MLKEIIFFLYVGSQENLLDHQIEIPSYIQAYRLSNAVSPESVLYGRFKKELEENKKYYLSLKRKQRDQILEEKYKKHVESIVYPSLVKEILITLGSHLLIIAFVQFLFCLLCRLEMTRDRATSLYNKLYFTSWYANWGTAMYYIMPFCMMFIALELKLFILGATLYETKLIYQLVQYTHLKECIKLQLIKSEIAYFNGLLTGMNPQIAQEIERSFILAYQDPEHSTGANVDMRLSALLKLGTDIEYAKIRYTAKKKEKMKKLLSIYTEEVREGYEQIAKAIITQINRKAYQQTLPEKKRCSIDTISVYVISEVPGLGKTGTLRKMIEILTGSSAMYMNLGDSHELNDHPYRLGPLSSARIAQPAGANKQAVLIIDDGDRDIKSGGVTSSLLAFIDPIKKKYTSKFLKADIEKPGVIIITANNVGEDSAMASRYTIFFNLPSRPFNQNGYVNELVAVAEAKVLKNGEEPLSEKEKETLRKKGKKMFEEGKTLRDLNQEAFKFTSFR